jgi:WD40 repeat protein
MNARWHEQMQRFVDGQLSGEECAALEKALTEDAELRAWYVDYMNLDVALAAAADAAAMTRTILPFEERRPPSRLTKVWRWPLVAGAAAAVLMLAGVSIWMWPREAAMARLDEVHGDVAVIDGGVGKAARSGQPLVSGNGLRVTGEESSATVIFADGTRLAVGADTTISKLTEDRASGKRLVLSEGFLTAQVAKQPTGRPMILATPQSEVVVLGTVFKLSSGTAVTHLETESGNVRLNRKSDGRSVEVPAGFEAIVTGSATLDAQLSAPRFREPRFSTSGHHRTTVLSPDGRTLVTSRFDSGSITLWDAASGRERMTLPAHAQRVIATAFSRDSRTLATGSIDQTIKLWDIDSGRLISELEGPAQIQAMSFSDGDAALVVLWGPPQGAKTLTTWKLGTRERQDHPNKYIGEAWLFSPSGRRLAMASARTMNVTLWDVATGRAETVLPRFPGRILCMAISPDESVMAVSDMSGSVTLWNVADAQLRQTFRPAGQTVQGLSFSADGALLAMGQRQATVRVWSVVDGRPRAILEGPLKAGSTGTVRPMYFSPDGRTLATTESLDAGTVRLWDLPPN